jgi:ABC-type transporter Mla MlaB component
MNSNGSFSLRYPGGEGMTFNYEQSGYIGVVSFFGELTVDYYDRLRSVLRKVVYNSDYIVLNLHKVMRIDWVCRRLFCAIHSISQKQGKDVKFLGKPPELLSCAFKKIQNPLFTILHGDVHQEHKSESRNITASISIKPLAEAVILQSLEDMFNPAHQEESLVFFTGEGFRIWSQLAELDKNNRLSLIRLSERIHHGRTA